MDKKVLQLENFKIDDSALKVGRKPISFRKIGEQVNPENMTRKEFTHYLCYKFEFNFGKGWDGIERHPHTPNWTEEQKYSEINSREDALEYLGILNKSLPDSIDKRQEADRRIKKEKISHKNKRKKIRRLQEQLDYKQETFLYYSALGLGFSVLIIIYTITILRLVK